MKISPLVQTQFSAQASAPGSLSDAVNAFNKSEPASYGGRFTLQTFPASTSLAEVVVSITGAGHPDVSVEEIFGRAFDCESSPAAIAGRYADWRAEGEALEFPDVFNAVADSAKALFDTLSPVYVATHIYQGTAVLCGQAKDGSWTAISY